MKIDINKKYKTESGKTVIIYTTTAANKNYPVVGHIIEDFGKPVLHEWPITGIFPKPDYKYNLVEIRPKISQDFVMKVVMHPDGRTELVESSTLHDGVAIARFNILVDCEVGEGLTSYELERLPSTINIDSLEDDK
jgi:hypothetical protein